MHHPPGSSAALPTDVIEPSPADVAANLAVIAAFETALRGRPTDLPPGIIWHRFSASGGRLRILDDIQFCTSDPHNPVEIEERPESGPTTLF